jgi:hypothetical protein
LLCSFLDKAYENITVVINRNNISSAYAALITYNANLSEKGTPAKLEDFLPYPVLEKKEEIKINKSTLNYLRLIKKQLPIFVRVALDKIL